MNILKYILIVSYVKYSCQKQNKQKKQPCIKVGILFYPTHMSLLRGDIGKYSREYRSWETTQVIIGTVIKRNKLDIEKQQKEKKCSIYFGAERCQILFIISCSFNLYVMLQCFVFVSIFATLKCKFLTRGYCPCLSIPR